MHVAWGNENSELHRMSLTLEVKPTRETYNFLRNFDYLGILDSLLRVTEVGEIKVSLQLTCDCAPLTL